MIERLYDIRNDYSIFSLSHIKYMLITDSLVKEYPLVV